jgi:hypothetical protein
MVVAITSINKSSGRRGAPMAPPPPLRPRELTTTRSQIKMIIWGQKYHDKVAKTLVGDEFDDQGCPDTDKTIDFDGRQHTKHLVIRHVRRALIVEMHTIDTYGLGYPHNDDDDNTNALNDGGEVQGDNDYHEPNRNPKYVGLNGPPTTHIIRVNH